MLGFWGLTVMPEKTYSQVVENSFKLSMAALDEVAKDGRTSVRVTVDKKTFILCNLISGKVEQQTLDLVFTEGESITFSVSGKNAVHLSGNYLPEDDGMDYDSEDMYGDDDDEEDEEDEEEDEDDEEEEDEDENEDETTIVTAGAKRVAKTEAPAKKQPTEKKQKVSEEKAVPVKAKKEEAKKEEAKKKEAPKKEEPKKEAPKKEEPKKKEAPKKEEPKDNKKVLPNGLIIEDVKVGSGAAAKSGKKIGMRYIGRLTSGKVFDKNTSGKPFNFNLGRGEVIKGWDLGIQGMQLGGERRLTIPPALAYGSQGAPPDIPRNATLVFEVKLVSLK